MTMDRDPPDRPALVVWEVATRSSHGVSTTASATSTIVDELSRFGPDQRVLVTGIDRISRERVQSIISVGQDAELDMVISPFDPRMLDRTFIRALASSGLSGISITLDGPDRTSHDDLNGGIGRFNGAVKLARWADEFGVALEVQTTVARPTVDGIEHLAAKILALNATRWTLSFVVPTEGGLQLEEVHSKQAVDLLRWIADIDTIGDLTIEIAQAPMYHRVADEVDDVSPSVDVHVAGDSLLYIGPDGTVSPSASLPIELGSILDDDVLELYRNHPLLQAIRDPSALTGKCRVCEYRGVCGGSRARAYAHFGDPLEQDPLCPFVPENIETTR